MDLPEHVTEQVFQALGAASMCWEKLESAGVFDSVKATEIGRELCDFLATELEARK